MLQGIRKIKIKKETRLIISFVHYIARINSINALEEQILLEPLPLSQNFHKMKPLLLLSFCIFLRVILKYATTHNHLQPSTTTHSHPQPPKNYPKKPKHVTSTTIYPQPSTTIHNHPQSSTTTLNYPQPPTTIHNQPQPSTNIYNQPQPSTTTQKLPKKAKTCQKQSCYCTQMLILKRRTLNKCRIFISVAPLSSHIKVSDSP